MPAYFHRNKFSKEQIEVLRQNPYVRSVNEDQVLFTPEFRELFWHLYESEGITPFDILNQLGIDYHMLGSSRVQGIVNSIKRERKLYGGIRGLQKDAATIRLPPDQEIARLKTEVEYLRQELEFLKKIISTGKTGRSR